MPALALAALCLGQIVARDVSCAGGTWTVDYTLAAPAGADLRVMVSGDVSVSRSPYGLGRNPHAVPRFSSVAAAPAAPGENWVVPGECRETLAVDLPAPGRVRLTLAHAHGVAGAHDPLLGVRAVAVRSGGREYADTLPLTREGGPAPAAVWAGPPPDRPHGGVTRTGRPCLYLNAGDQGDTYLRCPERPVRYGTRYKLSFFYLIARGTDGECAARLTQYEDLPASWRAVPGGGFEVPLRGAGRWTRVERVFRTAAETNAVALDFRLDGPGGVGEVWVSEVELVEVGAPGPRGP